MRVGSIVAALTRTAEMSANRTTTIRPAPLPLAGGADGESEINERSPPCVAHRQMLVGSRTG